MAISLLFLPILFFVLLFASGGQKATRITRKQRRRRFMRIGAELDEVDDDADDDFYPAPVRKNHIQKPTPLIEDDNPYRPPEK